MIVILYKPFFQSQSEPTGGWASVVCKSHDVTLNSNERCEPFTTRAVRTIIEFPQVYIESLIPPTRIRSERDDTGGCLLGNPGSVARNSVLDTVSPQEGHQQGAASIAGKTVSTILQVSMKRSRIRPRSNQSVQGSDHPDDSAGRGPSVMVKLDSNPEVAQESSDYRTQLAACQTVPSN